MRLFIRIMEEKIKLSAIIKTKNCEDKFCDTLESIKEFDEIIVIDEHSNDDTVEIAKEYKAKILYADKNNIQDAFKQSFDEAKNEWILILQESEILPQKLIYEIQNYISNPKKNKFCVSFHIKEFYLNKEIKSASKKNVLRLFKKTYADFKQEYLFDLKPINSKIHRIIPSKKAKNACILNFNKNDMHIKLSDILDKNRLMLKNATNKRFSIFKKPIQAFLLQYFIKGSIFEGRRGYIYSIEKFIENYVYNLSIFEKEAKNDIR